MYQNSPYREGYQKTEKGIKIVFKEIIAKNSPNLRKETYPDKGSTEDPKQDEPKHCYTKTYHN